LELQARLSAASSYQDRETANILTPKLQSIGLRPCLNIGVWNLFEIWVLLFGFFVQTTLNPEP
jgi:hypothetical protein